MKPQFILLLLIPSVLMAQTSDFEPAFKARYQMTFEADWSSTTHPSGYPSGAHFSPLIGLTHSADGIIWQSGSNASDGIEQMAEQGGRSLLRDKITALINNANAEFLLQGDGVSPSPGTTSFEFDISQPYPLVSLVSMIAPSPDWFVGINSLNLRQNGQWVDQLSVDLQAYDSGTDSGSSYTAADSDTNPAKPITRITEAPFADNIPLGRFVFQRLDSHANFPVANYHSGLYYDPERSGEGVNLIISKQDQRQIATLTWYTYRNNQQLWLVGSTDFEAGADSLTINVSRTQGTGFGPAFNPADIERIPWGSVSLSFPSCGKVILDYSSDNEFSSGQQTLTQLLGIADLNCP